ncbi:MAG: galactose mutarotase [Candidatus Ruminococcus intestinipullorum]|nr:galactose mutarotase [Candidatus Ruminococcus intestinipullorum]
MSVKETIFGTNQDGREIHLYTLQNQKGTEVKIANIGAAIVSVKVKNSSGEYTDVVLGYDDVKGYENNPVYFGVAVGRGANRIENAQFTLDGKTYYLSKNEGENNLHSGPDSYAFRVWDFAGMTENSVSLSLESPDQDQGYPGNLLMKVTYILTEENELKIHYEGECDQTTVVNMTNHTYFNLDGHNFGDVKEHWLQIEASKFTPIKDKASIPTGELWAVEGTPLDFKSGRIIGHDLQSDYEQMRFVNGYDHNFVIDGWDGNLQKVAEAKGSKSGITMKVYSDLPGVQLYTGNGLEHVKGKEDMYYENYAGFCLETQYFPNAINEKEFPSPILKKGDKYDTTTVYQFVVE